MVDRQPSLVARNLFRLDEYYPWIALRARQILQDLRVGRRGSAYRLQAKGEQYLCRSIKSPQATWIHGPESPVSVADRALGALAADQVDGLVVWRSGLGYLPAAAFARFRRRLVVLEPDEELFALSLDCTDWAAMLSSSRFFLAVGKHAAQQFIHLIQRCPKAMGARWAIIPGIVMTKEVAAEVESLKSEIRAAASEGSREGDRFRVDLFIHGPPTTALFFPALAEACARIGCRNVWRSSGDGRFRFLCSQSDPTSFLEHTKPIAMLGLNRGALSPLVEEAVSQLQIRQLLYFLEDPDWYDPSGETWRSISCVYIFDSCHGSRLGSPGLPIRRLLPCAASLREPKIFPTWMGAQRYPVTFVGSSGFERQADQYFEQMERVRPGVKAHFESLVEGTLDRGTRWLKQQLPTCDRLADLGSQGLQLKMIQETVTTRRRIHFLQALLDQPLTIFGDSGWADPHRAGRLAEKYAGRRTAYLTETPAVYCRSDVNINLFHAQCVHSINPRVYDVMACGGFLLSEYSPALDETFRIGEELDTFRSPEELRDKVRYYLAHPVERSEIARRGRVTVLGRHTWEHRLRRVLADL